MPGIPKARTSFGSGFSVLPPSECPKPLSELPIGHTYGIFDFYSLFVKELYL